MATKVKPRRTYNVSLRQEQAQATRQRVLAAARRLLVRGAYSQVTIEEIAREAGVAHQTVYAIFGTKLGLAQAMIDAGWPHIDQALKLVHGARASTDPEAWIRTMAALHRRIFEPCADLARFVRESGEPDLLARARQHERGRYERVWELAPILESCGRLRPNISADEAIAVAWTMFGPDYYAQLVLDRGWTPDRYEEWVSQALIDLILTPARRAQGLPRVQRGR
jgi:AcrR family transcriptional regulator